MNKWEEYERRKKLLNCKTPSEYEAEIKKLMKELKLQKGANMKYFMGVVTIAIAWLLIVTTYLLSIHKGG